MIQRDHITILGGGPAGLATGYYAKKKGMPFTIYEARDRLGGNAITVRHGEFRFDAGAHRFHDRDPEVTREIKELLGSDLLETTLTSHIHDHGKLLDFPLSPVNLLKTLNPLILLKSVYDLIRARLKPAAEQENFESAVVRMYGRAIAERFLLNYSEKLWGLPGESLSANISGSRLKSMNLVTFLREVLLGSAAKPANLEGAFYYPKWGYGAIVDELAKVCGDDHIHANSPVQAVHHNHSRIEALSIQSHGKLAVENVVNTMPLPLFLGMMDPPPPIEYLNFAKSMRFRNLLIVTLFLDMPRVTNSASIYFPGREFPFTRLHEPINRSPRMAPPGKTSLCVEYPCSPTDNIWRLEKNELIELTGEHLEKIGLIDRDMLIGGEIIRLGHAYPVLEVGIEDKLRELLDYLSGFSNLRMVGRNGRFVYTSLHDMLRFGLDVVEDLSRGRTAEVPSF